MRIILHADDFGFTRETSEATIECFEKGALTSASIMVNCDGAQLAIDYAKKHPEFSFGVHLTFVDGLKPISDSKEVRSLVDSKGFFLQSDEVRKKAISFQLNSDEITKEILSQIGVLEGQGIKISHLDSHGHLHKFPSFLMALLNVKKKYPDIKVRTVQNIFLSRKKKNISYFLNSLFRSFIVKRFKTTDFFYMPANSFDVNWSDRLLDVISRYDDNMVIEIGVHPGHLDCWRQNEFDDITTFSLKAINSHKFINWNDI